MTLTVPGAEFGQADDIIRRARAFLRPPPKLRLSTWIEQHVVLPEGVSATPGRVQLWPHQVEIADAIADPLIERVTLVKPVRIGFTFLLSAAVLSFIANDPAPCMVVQPTVDDARDYVVSDLDPTVRATPIVEGLLEDDEHGENNHNTMTSRRFPGGSLKIIAAKAPRNLRRHTVRVLFMDEVDGMEPTKEGSPLALAEKRTLSFPDRKIVIGSTPAHEETSNVLRIFAGSDQRVFEVPCYACGEFTRILWRHIEWPDGLPEQAAFRCPHCQELVAEQHKHLMVAGGRWRATHPENVGHAGFRINALVSLLANASWGKLAQEFVKAKEDTEELQTFVNTILAEGWQDEGERLDYDELAARAEPFSLDDLPEQVLLITAGTDVQDDRLETTILGWSPTDIYALGHVIHHGSPTDPQSLVWAELDDLLRKTRWQHPLGGQLGVHAAIVDSGDATDHVYAFCFPRFGRRIWAGKGMDGKRQAYKLSEAKVRRHGDRGITGRLVIIGVDTIKQALFDRLARGTTIHFSAELEPSWYDQLTAERKVVRYRRGQPYRSFERISGKRQAEALDCVVYGIAARHGCQGIDWEARRSALSVGRVERQQPIAPGERKQVVQRTSYRFGAFDD